MMPNIKQNPATNSLSLGALNTPYIVINTARTKATLSNRLIMFICNSLANNHSVNWYAYANSVWWISSVIKPNGIGVILIDLCPGLFIRKRLTLKYFSIRI